MRHCRKIIDWEDEVTGRWYFERTAIAYEAIREFLLEWQKDTKSPPVIKNLQLGVEICEALRGSPAAQNGCLEIFGIEFQLLPNWTINSSEISFTIESQ